MIPWSGGGGGGGVCVCVCYYNQSFRKMAHNRNECLLFPVLAQFRRVWSI